jgi:hypothetical protein
MEVIEPKPKNVYYQTHKAELNKRRLELYHKQRNNVPTEYIDSYRKHKKLYNQLKECKDSIDLELIFHLLNLPNFLEKEISPNI